MSTPRMAALPRRPRRTSRLLASMLLLLAVLALAVTSPSFAAAPRGRPCGVARAAFQPSAEAARAGGDADREVVMTQLGKLMSHDLGVNDASGLIDYNMTFNATTGKQGARIVGRSAKRKVNIKGAWAETEEEAKHLARWQALTTRLGVQSYGHWGVALKDLAEQVVGRQTDWRAIVKYTSQGNNKVTATGTLPKELFASGERPDGAADITGTGACEKSAKQALARAMLIFLCGAAAAGTAKKVRDWSSKVTLENISPRLSDKALRQKLEEFGEVSDFELWRNEEGLGQARATFAHPLIAWTAHRMLHGEMVEDTVLLMDLAKEDKVVAKQNGKVMAKKKDKVVVKKDKVLAKTGSKARQPKRHRDEVFTARGRGESKIYFSNVPKDMDFPSVLSIFVKAGRVRSIECWEYPKTRAFRGKGLVSFGSAKENAIAMKKLHEVRPQGWRLWTEPAKLNKESEAKKSLDA